MKLLLTSGGLTNKSIISTLRDLVQKPFNQLRLAFVPTASNIEEGDKWWLIKDLETCRKLKFKSIDIVDISALPKEIWQKRLEKANLLLFEGGNTYYLMYWIMRSGLQDQLPKLLESRVYVGISAGSRVVTTGLALSDTKKEFIKKTGKEISDKGLGYVDFQIEPHINSPHFPKRTFEAAGKQPQTISNTLYAIDDNTAIKVAGERVTVVSEGKWKKFN